VSKDVKEMIALFFRPPTKGLQGLTACGIYSPVLACLGRKETPLSLLRCGPIQPPAPFLTVPTEVSDLFPSIRGALRTGDGEQSPPRTPSRVLFFSIGSRVLSLTSLCAFTSYEDPVCLPRYPSFFPAGSEDAGLPLRDSWVPASNAVPIPFPTAPKTPFRGFGRGGLFIHGYQNFYPELSPHLSLLPGGLVFFCT